MNRNKTEKNRMKTVSRNTELACQYITFCLLTVILLLGSFGCNLASRADRQAREDLYANYDAEFKRLLSSANRQMSRDVLQYESIAADLLPKRITLAGTHHELGYLMGLIAKDYFGDPMKVEIKRKPESEEINRRIVAMYRSIYPQYLELVSGVAEAYELSLDGIDLRYMEHSFFTLLWWRLFRYQQFEEITDYYSPANNIFDFSKCSIVSYFSNESRIQMFGRNFDVSSDRPHFFVTTALEGTYKTMGNTCYMLYHWIEDGINEKGLVIGVATNGSPSKYNQREPDYPNEPAVQVIHMVRIVLDTCATVDEALALIGSVRIWFPVEVNHLLIADSKGQAAVVEFDVDRNMVAFRRKEPYLVLTNTAYQEGIDFVKEHCGRYRKGVSMCKSGIRATDDMLKVMKAMQLKSGNNRTLWTSITDLSKRRMDVRFRSENYSVPHIFELTQ